MMSRVRHGLGAHFFDGRYTIGLWHWEMASFPPEWREECAALDELWVASEFVRESLAAAVPVPVHRVRLPIVMPRHPARSRAELGLPEGRFVWLFAFDVYSHITRKNPLGVVEAFRRAFGAHAGDAQLVVRARHIDQFPEEAARLRAAVESVGGTLVTRSLSRDEVAALFAACDGYVSLHRCEGFGLTMAEAMALGKPVVATAYSGNMDFMTEENSYLVRFRMAEIERDHGPYRRGMTWAEPDLDHAAEQMRAVVDCPDEARGRGAAAAADIARLYGSGHVGRSVVDHLRAVGGGL
jgi:glycosyltransferase involved in cell wall biosynthesis